MTHDHELDSYERNRWFRGKMVTARDLNAEWAYHADRLNTLARFTVGEGIVCGLETSVTAKDESTLTVRIAPGLGIDSVGRHVIVHRRAERELDVAQVQSEVSLYLAYRECGKESVPALDGDHGCGDERCEYNRLLETFELVAGPKPADSYGRVRPLQFPALDAFPDGYLHLDPFHGADDADDGNGNGNGTGNGNGNGGVDETVANAAFRTVTRLARSYNGVDGDPDAPLSSCDSGAGPLDRIDDGTEREDQPAVFLGTFTELNGEWRRDEDVPLRFVATNQLLHDAVVDHAAQFDNPHQVRLDRAVNTGFNSGLLFAAHEDDPEPVALVSSDGNITYRPSTVDNPDPSGGGGTLDAVDLSVPGLDALTRTVETLQAEFDVVKAQIPQLRRYVFDKTMKYKLESYRDAAEAFEGRMAGDVADLIAGRTLTGIDARRYADVTEFSDFLFGEQVDIVFSEPVTGSLDGGILTLTEPDPTGGDGDELTYEIDLSTQVFDTATVSETQVNVTTSVFGFETLFVELLGEELPEQPVSRYRNALAAFEDVPKPGEAEMPAETAPVVLELAVLQDQLCEAVDWLVEPESDVETDTRPVGNVFRGQTGVDLRTVRGAPGSGEVRLFDVTDSTDAGVVVDVSDADITAEQFGLGSYGFEGSRTTTSVVVVEPTISDLSLRFGQQDATTKPIPAGTTQPMLVSATFNFSSAEGVAVTVTDGQGLDITADLTNDAVLTRQSDVVKLDVSDLDEGAYTVDVTGESMFTETERTAAFSVVDARNSLSFNPSSVTEKSVTTGTFTSGREGSVFVLVPKSSYTNQKLFDERLSGRQRLLDTLFFGDAVERVDLSEEYVFAELTLTDGDASFKFNSSGLKTSTTGRLPKTSHPITISTDPNVAFPPRGADKDAVLATAELTVRKASDGGLTLREDAGDIIFNDHFTGELIVIPSGEEEIVVLDHQDFTGSNDPIDPLGDFFDDRVNRDRPF